MKKFYPAFYAAFLLCVVACSNEAPAANVPAVSTPVATAPPASPTVAKKDIVVTTHVDTARTTISLGKSGGSVKTKKGTEVNVGQEGVKIGTKEVKIDIKRDSD